MARFVPALLLSALLLATAPATAQQHQWIDSPPSAVVAAGESDELVPLRKVMKMVGKRYDGKVVDAFQVDGGGDPIYIVRVLTESGEVRDVRVDARSGQIIGD